jgi:hypothetical protein
VKNKHALLIGKEAAIAMEMMNLLVAAITNLPMAIKSVLVSVKHKY